MTRAPKLVCSATDGDGWWFVIPPGRWTINITDTSITTYPAPAESDVGVATSIHRIAGSERRASGAKQVEEKSESDSP